MTLSIKDQIYEGTAGVYTADGVGDRMRVRAMVFVTDKDGVLDGPQLIRNAVNAYFNDENGGKARLFSPGHSALPVQKITGKQITRNIVELSIEYSNRGVVGSRELAKFQTVTTPTTIFTKSKDEGGTSPIYVFGLPFAKYIDGRPISEQLSTSDIKSLRTRSYPRSAVRIQLSRISIGDNPLSIWGPYLRSTSSNQVLLPGFTASKGTLLLEGIQTTATSAVAFDIPGTDDTYQYNYNLSFLYDPNKFPVQGFKKVSGGDEDLYRIDITEEFDQLGWNL